MSYENELTPEENTNRIVQHIQNTLGQPLELSYLNRKQTEPEIGIQVVKTESNIALVTVGMSSIPLATPPEAIEFRFAELVMYLPHDWPINDDSIHDPNFGWPFQQLLKIPYLMHEQDGYIDGHAAVIELEDGQTLSQTTSMNGFLALMLQGEFSQLVISDNQVINFYALMPLYPAEIAYEESHGVGALIEKLQQQEVQVDIDVNRKCAV